MHGGTTSDDIKQAVRDAQDLAAVNKEKCRDFRKRYNQAKGREFGEEVYSLTLS